MLVWVKSFSFLFFTLSYTLLIIITLQVSGTAKIKYKILKQDAHTHTVVNIRQAMQPLKSYVCCIWWGGLLQYVNYMLERCCNVGELEHSPQLINTLRSACVMLANQNFHQKNSKTTTFSVDSVWNIICNILCHEHTMSPSQNYCFMWSCQSWALLFTAVESDLNIFSLSK